MPQLSLEYGIVDGCETANSETRTNDICHYWDVLITVEREITTVRRDFLLSKIWRGTKQTQKLRQWTIYVSYTAFTTERRYKPECHTFLGTISQEHVGRTVLRQEYRGRPLGKASRTRRAKTLKLSLSSRYSAQQESRRSIRSPWTRLQ